MSPLTNKNIWVIGASSGIGRALAEQLAKNGNSVIISARSAAPLNQLLLSYPKHIKILTADFSSEEHCAQLQNQLIEHTDVLDLVLYCAGTCEYDDAPNLDIDMYKRVFEINFFGCMRAIKMAMPMLTKSGGHIAVTSSLAARVPFPRAEAYGASKVALEYLIETLKIDLHDKGISLSIIRPGFVDTPLTQKNDFPMPFIVDTQFACMAIIDGLEKGKAIIEFPWRLSLILRIASFFRQTWINRIAPKFKKNTGIKHI